VPYVDVLNTDTVQRALVVKASKVVGLWTARSELSLRAAQDPRDGGEMRTRLRGRIQSF
jgi:hypothetical protein